MNWEDATKRALGTALNTFGKSATYTPAVGAASTITGVFDRGYRAIEFNGVETSSFAITFAIKLEDLSANPVSGDQVTIDGTTYKIIESQEDGQGGAILILHET